MRYRDFVKKGIARGGRPELSGGGLVRSAGGWSAVKMLRRSGLFQKADERILAMGILSSGFWTGQKSGWTRHTISSPGGMISIRLFSGSLICWICLKPRS